MLRVLPPEHRATQMPEMCRVWVSVASVTCIVSVPTFSVAATAGGNQQLIFGGYMHSWKEGANSSNSLRLLVHII
jgi:hypothetical protein